VFADTPNRNCTSNDQPWTAARSLPPATKSIEPGAYSGRQLQTGSRITFLVPAGAGSVLDFSIPGVYVYCAGGGSYGAQFKIPKATIARPTRRSRTSSPDISRGTTQRGRRPRLGCGASTSCSSTRPTAPARRTTNPGQRLGRARAPANERKLRRKMTELRLVLGNATFTVTR
jgi:hypothetical protein